MGFWEAAVLIVAIMVIGQVMRGGRWNKDKRRWETFSPENPYVRMGEVKENPELRQEINRLSARVTTLEKLALEPGRQLSDEIERLRELPPAKESRPDRPSL